MLFLIFQRHTQSCWLLVHHVLGCSLQEVAARLEQAHKQLWLPLLSGIQPPRSTPAAVEIALLPHQTTTWSARRAASSSLRPPQKRGSSLVITKGEA